MENKEIMVVPPEGYEIDKENSTFECIKFKPIEDKLPRTWEEYCKTHPVVKKEYFVTGTSVCSNTVPNRFRDAMLDKNLLPSRELVEAILALCQLIQLRDCYNDGWEPDWTTGSIKYIIAPSRNRVIRYHAWVDNKILAFKTEEIRDQFFENFKDLIEIAKPLL